MPGTAARSSPRELREVGIELEIIPVEWADWLEQVFTDKDYDLTIVSHTEPNDIDIYSRKDYYFNYDNPAFDKVIDELNLTSDEAKRNELYEPGAEDPRRRRRDRLPVRTAEDRRLGRQGRRPVGERADPGQRPDQGEVGRIVTGSVALAADISRGGRLTAACTSADARAYAPAGSLLQRGETAPSMTAYLLRRARPADAGLRRSWSSPCWRSCPATPRG